MPVQGEFQADTEPETLQCGTRIMFGQIGKADTTGTLSNGDNLYAL
jgi:hypothetical protein